MSSINFDILTIFPELINRALPFGVLGKAIDAGKVSILASDIRSHSKDKHRRVDDTPYGGGPGMVMGVEPIVRAIEAVDPDHQAHRILLSPRGTMFTQRKAQKLAEHERLLLICGRYEGVDERVGHFIDEELSIGDYILAGGDYAALVVVDALVRLMDGVIGDPESLKQESHNAGTLEYPQYTRPRDFRGQEVPAPLLSGNHEQIRRWREEQAISTTRKRRPDLMDK